MDITDILCGSLSEQMYAFDIDGYMIKENGLCLNRGFYFLLVTDGMADASDICRNHIICKADLLILTPSLSVVLRDAGDSFSASCLYMRPEYFDTLQDGHPMYVQLAGFINRGTFPVFHIHEDVHECLSATFLLSGMLSGRFTVHEAGIYRHMASVFLLEMADILCNADTGMPACVKRPNEIFCRFRRLLAENHCRQHSISFYADKLHISTAYLSRIVKKITEHTVYDHIAAMILADSRRMLQCCDMEIKEIADRLGFSDQSAFGKFFKSHTGLSPAYYRAHPETWQGKSRR